jgi:hypothetical protein
MAVGQSAKGPTAKPKTKRTHYMRLKLLLPEVKPGHFVLPKNCQMPECKGKRFYPRQAVEKKIVDAKHK